MTSNWIDAIHREIVDDTVLSKAPDEMVFESHEDLVAWVTDIMRNSNATMMSSTTSSNADTAANSASNAFMQFCEPVLYTAYNEIVETYEDRGFFDTKRYGDFLDLVSDNVMLIEDAN
jgi:hypothetical protein